MMSLRKRLLAWLLAGVGTLWLIVGMAVYATIRTSLEGKFDAELKAIASEVRYVLPESRRLQTSKPSAFWFEFFQKDSGLYFESWDQFLLFSDRSPNLGDRSLPRPESFTEEPHVWNFELATGEKVRGLAQQFSLTGNRKINVVVARNRDALDRALELLLAATGLVGFLIFPLALLMVRAAIGRGLQPLRAFDNRVATFGLDSLHERLETTGLPDELIPISQRLNELMDRLESGVERERRLNADLSHELRTPVAELRTMAEVALTWPDKINGNHYRDVLAAAKQMQSTIEGMLLLARCDRDGDAPAQKWVHVAELAGKCWQPHANAAAGKGLQLHELIPSDFGVLTNPDLFQIILANLIANAVEYSPEGGLITIECREDNGRFILSVANPVSDMENEDMPHLFERFWRRDSSRSGSSHAGLGLSLAKACAGVLSLELTVEMKDAQKIILFVIKSKTANSCKTGVYAGTDADPLARS